MTPQTRLKHVICQLVLLLYFPFKQRGSHFAGAAGTVDVILLDDEALVGQRQGALLAVEAVLVPGEALVVHHVGAVAKPCGGVHQLVTQVRGKTRGCCTQHT